MSNDKISTIAQQVDDLRDAYRMLGECRLRVRVAMVRARERLQREAQDTVSAATGVSLEGIGTDTLRLKERLEKAEKETRRLTDRLRDLERKAEREEAFWRAIDEQEEGVCSTCKGTGKVLVLGGHGDPCQACNGTGKPI